MKISLKKVMFLILIISIAPVVTAGCGLIETLFEEKQGTITIVNIDINTNLPVKGTEYIVSELESGNVIETLVTDKDGKAISSLLDYNSIYEVKQSKHPSYYQRNNDAVFSIEIQGDNQEITVENTMLEYIKDFEVTSDGDIEVKEAYISVPTIMQEPELPNGCEITSLTAVLNYNNYETNKTEMSDKYLTKEAFYRRGDKLYGANPYKAFSGEPRDLNGWFVYAPPIVKAANSYLDTTGSNMEAIDISGSTQEQIIEEINKGNPVVVWVTRELKQAKLNYSWYLSDTGEYFEAPINLHAVVINGYADDEVHVMDPLKGQIVRDMDKFFKSYHSLGSHAVVIH